MALTQSGIVAKKQLAQPTQLSALLSISVVREKAGRQGVKVEFGKNRTFRQIPNAPTIIWIFVRGLKSLSRFLSNGYKLVLTWTYNWLHYKSYSKGRQ